jgi:beta-galactosidase beta subunit
MDLYYNNSEAIAQANEPRAHNRAKHVLQHYHLIREIIGRGDIKVCKVHIYHNVADLLTEPLPQLKHEAHIRYMGIRYLYE